MLKDWNFWFSIITAIVAIAALVLSFQQVYLSNKQHLFDKRMECYIIAAGLIELYKKHYKLFESKNENKPITSNGMYFCFLTSNTYLEKITPVIEKKNLLENPYQKEFLTKLENLKNVAIKIELLFGESDVVLMSNFVYCYQELLHAMYRYEILLKEMDGVRDEWNYSLEKCMDAVHETEHREDLLSTFKSIKDIYTKLEEKKIEEKIKKEIRLY